mmetsp:Transcript_16518/g.21442  ORF Transcript_16518/g.21442 Transcript_16518/m.21442 type:complete len:206 (-) Transcript_16518:1291-1908(-)
MLLLELLLLRLESSPFSDILEDKRLFLKDPEEPWESREPLEARPFSKGFLAGVSGGCNCFLLEVARPLENFTFIRLTWGNSENLLGGLTCWESSSSLKSLDSFDLYLLEAMPGRVPFIGNTVLLLAPADPLLFFRVFSLAFSMLSFRCRIIACKLRRRRIRSANPMGSFLLSWLSISIRILASSPSIFCSDTPLTSAAVAQRRFC